MITRIELKNFMSHEHTVIEPGAGLTVLVGPNNVGKSAVVAALQILATNANSKSVMRHGAKECSVRVDTQEGHAIIWQRKTSSSYIINGNRHDRLGNGGLPEELPTALRLGSVESGNKSFDVHFGSQKDPIFLINGSGGDAAKFFASSSDAHQLVNIQRLHKEKLTEEKREKNRLETESSKLEKQLAALIPVVSVKQRCEQLTELHEQIQAFEKSIAQLQNMILQLENQHAVCEQLQTRSQVLATLHSPPALQNDTALEHALTLLATTQFQVVHFADQASALQSLTEVPQLYPVEKLEQAIAQRQLWERQLAKIQEAIQVFQHLPTGPFTLLPAEALEQLLEQLQQAQLNAQHRAAQHSALATLVPVPEITSEAQLMQIIVSLDAITKQTAKLENIQACLETLQPVPLPDIAWQPLEQFLQICSETVTACALHAETFAAAQASAEEYAIHLRAQVEGMECPTCHQPMNPENFLLRAGLGLPGHAHE